MSSEQPLPKQSEAQDGVRWMGGKEARGGCHVRYRRRRRQHPCGGGSGSKPWTQTPCRRRRRQHPCDGGGSKPWTETPCRRVPWLWPWASGRKLRPQLGSTGASQRAAAAALPPGHGGAGSKLGPKRRAAESRGCGRRPWAGNCGRSSAARGSVQVAKRAAAPNHASRPRRMPSGAPYRWAHPSNTEHAPGGEGGPGCPGQSGPPSSKRRPVCVLNE